MTYGLTPSTHSWSTHVRRLSARTALSKKWSIQSPIVEESPWDRSTADQGQLPLGGAAISTKAMAPSPLLMSSAGNQTEGRRASVLAGDAVNGALGVAPILGSVG